MLHTFSLLVLGHFTADICLQTDFVAKHKSYKASLPAIPWYYVLLGHTSIHGLMVYLITGSLFLALSETIVHFIIDVLKCGGITSIHVDQFLHIACKILWVLLLHYHVC